MSRRSKVETNHDLRAGADENLAEAALGAQLYAVLDLRDHVDDLAAAGLPKSFGQ
ncbi:MAG: hypothetical protein QOH05_609 [Acetobacteraceae bacterium]|jgi:hypothetical protein|nr:hypothetical protein [Acetobacteraceae bacterium]